MTRPLQAALVASLVIAAGVIGFGAYRWSAVPPAAPVRPPVVSVDDESGAAIPPAEASKAVPATLPEFSLQDRDGRLRSITEWQGKSLVINFWATWCAPCRREIPMLKALHAARAQDNVEVIGIAVDFRDQVLAYARKIGLDYPLLIGEQDGLEAVDKFGLGVIGFPFTVFTDNRGRIVTAHVGELHAKEADVILDAVIGINTGALSLGQAKERISAGLQRLDEGGEG